jgi:hypothetical protein
MTEHEARAREIVLRAGKCREDDALSYFDHLCDGIASALKEQAETIARLRAVLEGFQRIAFVPCQDVRCYRPTLTMMQRANAALSGNIPNDPA